MCKYVKSFDHPHPNSFNSLTTNSSSNSLYPNVFKYLLPLNLNSNVLDKISMCKYLSFHLLHPNKYKDRLFNRYKFYSI